MREDRGRPVGAVQPRRALLEAVRAESRPLDPALDPAVALDALAVQRVELELQNEELRAAQAQLIESRDGARELFDGAPIPFVTLDACGAILEANEAATDLLEGPGVGVPLSAATTFEGGARVVGELLRAACLGQRADREVRITTRSGRRRRVRAIFKAAREGQQVRAALIDLTGQPRAGDVGRALLGVCAALASATTRDELLAGAARALVGGAAEACVIDLITPRELDAAAHVAHADPTLEPALVELERGRGAPASVRAARAAALRERRSYLVPATNEDGDPAGDAPLDRLQLARWLVVPVLQGRACAAVLRLGVASDDEARLGPEAVELLERVARKLGKALERIEVQDLLAAATAARLAALQGVVRDVEASAAAVLAAATAAEELAAAEPRALPLLRSLRLVGRSLTQLADHTDEVSRIEPWAPRSGESFAPEALLRDAMATLPAWVHATVELEGTAGLRLRGDRARTLRALALLLRHDDAEVTRWSVRGWRDGGTYRLSVDRDGAAPGPAHLRLAAIEGHEVGVSVVLARALVESQGGSVWVAGRSYELALPCIHAV